MKNICHKNHRNSNHRNGPTSIHLHSPEQVFNNTDIKTGNTLLDLGCGIGDYAIYASTLVGKTGIVHAIDKNENIISSLCKEIKDKKISNMEAKCVDITGELPFKKNSIDVCLIVTVLHAIAIEKTSDVISEVRRVLKPNGRLIIIDCKKELTHFGPPTYLRISEQEMEAIVGQFDFRLIKQTDLKFNYMLEFEATSENVSQSIRQK